MPPLLSPSPSRPARARWSAHGLVRLVPQSPGMHFPCSGTRPQHPGRSVGRWMSLTGRMRGWVVCAVTVDGARQRPTYAHGIAIACMHGLCRSVTFATTTAAPAPTMRYDGHHGASCPPTTLTLSAAPAHSGCACPPLLPRRGLAVVGHVLRSQHHAEPAKYRTPDSSMTVYLAVRGRARGWWWRLLATTNTVLTRRAALSRGRAHGSGSIRACQPFRTAPILRALSIKLSPL